jgi:hypothetical protein
MNIQMYLGDDLIDDVPLPSLLDVIPIVSQLKILHQQEIELRDTSPTFVMEKLPYRLNLLRRAGLRRVTTTVVDEKNYFLN